MSTDWAVLHRKIVDAFAAGWADIDSRALDSVLADDVELVQPLIPTCTSRQQWWGHVDKLRNVARGLHSEVLDWSGNGSILFIEHRLGAMVGRYPVSIVAVDKIRIDTTGLIIGRVAFFDPAPLIQAVLKTPSAWRPWWQSGLGPFTGRRRIFN